jgi:hypothetical protein
MACQQFFCLTRFITVSALNNADHHAGAYIWRQRRCHRIGYPSSPGLKDSGAKGFIHGVMNGVGGFLSKPVAGSCIVPLIPTTRTSLAL